MKKLAILFYSIIIVLNFSCGSSSDEKITIDINDTKALTEYLQGKWEHNEYSSNVNETRRYRFEINGNKLKMWSCISNLDDPFNMKEGYDEFNFELSSPDRDNDGYHSRYLIINEFNNKLITLEFRALSPIWLVSDKHWDTPVIRSGAGLPTWDRANFETVGQLKHNDNSYSNATTVNTDNSYATPINEESIESNSADPTFNEDNTNAVYLTVESSRAYFYDEADVSSKTKKFLIKGDVAELYEEGNEYVKVSYKNKDGKETVGWISKSDFNQSATTNTSSESSNEQIYSTVEEMPQFPGGATEMMNYIQKNIQYPQMAKEAGLSGKCYLKFIVAVDGTIKDIQIVKGVPGCKECDTEAKRVVSSMPNWKAGKQNGRAVNVSFNLPVNFQLR